MKHGLCSRNLALPDEDPAAVAARREHWHAFFQPRSPDAQFLLEECVHATLMADRFHRAHDTAVANQIDDLAAEWEKERWKLVTWIRSWLEDDPAKAVADLKGFSHGCRWLAGRWQRLGEALDGRGYWLPDECAEATRLRGLRADPGEDGPDEEAYLILLFNLRCQPVPPEAAIEALLQPARRPAALRAHERARLQPEPATCRAALRQTVADELAPLRAAEKRLRAEVDPGERAVLLDPAAILKDAEQARRYLRYQAEYRSTFHRAHKALLATLGRDAELDLDPEPPAQGPGAAPEPGASTVLEAVPTRGAIPAGQVDSGPRNEPRNEAVEPIAEEESAPAQLTEPQAEERLASPPGSASVPGSSQSPAPGTNPAVRPERTPQPGHGTDRIARENPELGRRVRVDREVDLRRLWDFGGDRPSSKAGDQRRPGVEPS